MKLLSGKTALVTGASRGIGRGIAIKLAQQGANVIFTYSASAQKAEELATLLQQEGVKALAVKSDAADYNAAEALIATILAEFTTIDIVINNAGITRDNLLMRMTEAHFDEVIATNLKSVFNITKAVQKQLLKQRSGSIINISSVVGVKG
ncbi:MAG TPA: SDR family NAD(P)-dependent oxidoreductase, partial [Bacteroidia bacterium]|nr:SDR family NAD(P)-dependent oxidoreductase [Bacteroidia bacterium]